jgi:hypothetical protein
MPPPESGSSNATRTADFLGFLAGKAAPLAAPHHRMPPSLTAQSAFLSTRRNSGILFILPIRHTQNSRKCRFRKSMPPGIAGGSRK